MLRITLLTALGAVFLFLLTLELTRRRRLSERYSILWFATAVVVFGVAMIPGVLDFVARSLGIAYAPSALLLVALVFVLALILHLSMVISRLTAQTARLAQTVAILKSTQETPTQTSDTPNAPVDQTETP
jgi:hypothetical protein